MSPLVNNPQNSPWGSVLFVPLPSGRDPRASDLVRGSDEEVDSEEWGC